MGDSTLSGTNKEDQAGNRSERNPKQQGAENTNLQQRSGQPGGMNQSQPSKTATGDRVAGKDDASTAGANPGNRSAAGRSGAERKPASDTGEEHIRSLSTPPGEPYNDPKVRNRSEGNRSEGNRRNGNPNDRQRHA